MKFLLPAILSVFIVSSLFAQDDVKEKDYSAHGIQFQIGSNFQLQNYDGLTLSYLYRTRSNYVLRFGISTDFTSENKDDLIKADSFESNSTLDRNDFGVLLSCDFIFTLAEKGDFSMIAGGGPFVSFGGASSETTEGPDYLFGKRIVTGDMSNWGAGAGILLGVNYNLSDNVEISGEYGMKIGYFSQTNTSKEETVFDNEITIVVNRETNMDSFKIVNSNARLGIAIYF